MKTCPWCGEEYPDEVSNCVIDQYVLEPRDPAPVPAVLKPEKSEAEEVEVPRSSQKAEDESAPEGFQVLGAYDAFEAERLLKQFSETNIRFEIDRIERRESGQRSGYRIVNYIKIFIHNDDFEKAWQIATEDWKV